MPPRALCLIAALALSCSSSVELSGDAQLEASDNPTVLGSINERILAVAVDDERVYWFGAQSGSDWEAVGALRSCKKAQCIGSLVTYDSGAAQPVGFTVSQGRIYWVQQGEHERNTISLLRSCDVAGCGEPPTSQFVGPYLTAQSAVFDGDSWYVLSTRRDLLKITAAGEQVPLALVRSAPSSLLAVHDGYVYVIRPSDEIGNSKYVIARIRGDGKDEAKIADNLDLHPYDRNIYSSGGLEPAFQNTAAFDANYIYWVQGGLRGSIARCPTSGCLGAPEVVVPLVRLPSALLIDGPQVYFRHDTLLEGSAISKCNLAQCLASAPLVVGLDASHAFAVDDRFLFTATAEQDLNSNAAWQAPSAQLRRIDK